MSIFDLDILVIIGGVEKWLWRRICDEDGWMNIDGDDGISHSG
ncbi:hypothetical protein [Bacillus sp. WP8]|nr:hypothetical protein [Bacillus sp. WP8]